MCQLAGFNIHFVAGGEEKKEGKDKEGRDQGATLLIIINGKNLTV